MNRNIKTIHSHTQEQKKELKRIEWKTVKRITTSLLEYGRMKSSHIAITCKMGYDKCRLYLDWLEMMELIRKETNDDGFEEMTLTEKGKVLSKKFDNIRTLPQKWSYLTKNY